MVTSLWSHFFDPPCKSAAIGGGHIVSPRDKLICACCLWSRLGPLMTVGYGYALRNETVSKIITPQSIYFLTAVSILVISNHNSFRVPFDKIASVYFI